MAHRSPRPQRRQAPSPGALALLKATGPRGGQDGVEAAAPGTSTWIVAPSGPKGRLWCEAGGASWVPRTAVSEVASRRATRAPRPTGYPSSHRFAPPSTRCGCSISLRFNPGAVLAQASSGRATCAGPTAVGPSPGRRRFRRAHQRADGGQTRHTARPDPDRGRGRGRTSGVRTAAGRPPRPQAGGERLHAARIPGQTRTGPVRSCPRRPVRTPGLNHKA